MKSIEFNAWELTGIRLSKQRKPPFLNVRRETSLNPELLNIQDIQSLLVITLRSSHSQIFKEANK
jgi:hypothetical protein